jgi:hypothetical protein
MQATPGTIAIGTGIAAAIAIVIASVMGIAHPLVTASRKWRGTLRASDDRKNRGPISGPRERPIVGRTQLLLRSRLHLRPRLNRNELNVLMLRHLKELVPSRAAIAAPGAVDAAAAGAHAEVTQARCREAWVKGQRDHRTMRMRGPHPTPAVRRT